MAKADGMKVYILCYTSGYVVCTTDPEMTALSCMVTINSTGMPELTNRPDVVVAELIADGSMVYIDTLGMNGNAKLSVDLKRYKWPIATRRPYMIYRKGVGQGADHVGARAHGDQIRSPHQAPGRVLRRQIEQHGTTATMLLLLTLSREDGPGRHGVGGRADSPGHEDVADSVHVAEQIPGHVRERDVALFDIWGLAHGLGQGPVLRAVCGQMRVRGRGPGQVGDDEPDAGHGFPIYYDTEDSPGNIINFAQSLSNMYRGMSIIWYSTENVVN
ncbi:hypothetical protein Z517_09315 [Fonsecaea pedrosoi CBS 271.37]|uniref:Unplaced genomic scaffold supercont1.6, whole genome shotgun sequence n=1 Tax=Fonsecaea pedrosoi CBS 271.37 TaxID=1442368 RepID=A0A0D2DGQ9_9EURO|nr:uncharacterized protein Z517_09315 [Fonsecaea pedrosoi CBS 271.37]KIW76871.1 hypothetical protein Z517_09315 [Fonsecaea pedrosoi CBS 271.37]